jgi:DNA polymerase I
LDLFRHYRTIWAADFEFVARPGGRPVPLCLVARELRTKQLVRHWLTDSPQPRPPYPVGENDLFVAFYASAELGCHLALGWPMPTRIIDLFVEFRNLTNGRPPVWGNSLLGALMHFGLDALESTEKEEMRQLALRGGPHNAAERAALLAYCQTDVDALVRLLDAMAADLDLPRALLRGRYMAAAARIESVGVPIDVEVFGRLTGQWDRVKARVVREVDREYGVYIPTQQSTTVNSADPESGVARLSFSSALV